MEALQREFDDLRTRWEADHKQLVKLEAAGDRTPQVVVQRERKLRRFGGTADEQIDEWMEEARACLTVHNLAGIAAANFVLSYLEGAARVEIKCRPAEERSDVEKIFRALEEVYGETQTPSRILRMFYERRQKEGESVASFSHALVQLIDRLQRVDPSERSTERMLREQFSENVRNLHLRWDLKRRAEQDSDCSFLAIRKVAMVWAKEVDGESVIASDAASRAVVTDRRQDSATDALHQLVKDLSIQQKVLADNMAAQQVTMAKLFDQQKQLVEAVAAITANTSTGAYSSNNPRRGDIECYFCRRRGHVKRDCLAFLRMQQSGNQQTGGNRQQYQGN